MSWGVYPCRWSGPAVEETGHGPALGAKPAIATALLDSSRSMRSCRPVTATMRCHAMPDRLALGPRPSRDARGAAGRERSPSHSPPAATARRELILAPALAGCSARAGARAGLGRRRLRRERQARGRVVGQGTPHGARSEGLDSTLAARRRSIRRMCCKLDAVALSGTDGAGGLGTAGGGEGGRHR